MSNSDSQNQFEKKTERLDVRLSNEKKQSFTAACENQGDTPSQAVRRFINSYIRRANRDDVAAALRPTMKRKSFVFAGAIVVSLIVTAFFIPKLLGGKDTQLMTSAQLFAHYDYDDSGIIELNEISVNDSHLHRVLNIDGVAGISPDEFIAKDTMAWRFIVPEDWVVVDNKVTIDNRKSKMKHTRTLRMRAPKFPEGALIPTGNPKKPFLTVEEFMALGQPLHEVQKNLEIKPREIRMLKSIEAPVNPSKFVIFDLSNPQAVQIDVMEFKSRSEYSKSMVFSRSVDWVEGDKAPHHVMGMGSTAWEARAK